MLSDTSADALRVQIELLRKATPSQRFRLVCDLTTTAVELSRAAIRRAGPELSESEAKLRWAELHYGGQLADQVRGHSRIAAGDMSQIPLFAALKPVIEAFEGLSVAYYLGGSVASSFYGVARTTLDADLVADLEAGHAPPLIARLGDEYYASQEAISDAIARKSCFNVIHLTTMFKVDVFVAKPGLYDRQALARRRSAAVFLGGVAEDFMIASPEDVILSKLQWFRLGQQVSERQWQDVLGVLRVQGPRLDEAYLLKWARELGIGDLLARARQAIPSPDLHSGGRSSQDA